jgi:hypothetical protein
MAANWTIEAVKEQKPEVTIYLRGRAYKAKIDMSGDTGKSVTLTYKVGNKKRVDLWRWDAIVGSLNGELYLTTV